jgi:hypothetical protein
MSESNEETVEQDEPVPTGSDEGAEEMMRELTSAPVAPVRPIDNQPRRLSPNAITEHLNRLNDLNAGRQERYEPKHRGSFPESDKATERMLTAEYRKQQGIPDAADTSAPVLGVLDLIEEINATSQRYGAFAHWPNEKKSAALALVTRTISQHAIAQQVVAVNRRDSVHARAYRERRRLAREAATLVRTYFKFGQVQQQMITNDILVYTEAINYLGRFAKKVADLPELPSDEEKDPKGGE